MTFKEKVYNVVKQIKKGKVLTYKQVAEKIGHPKSYRAVGNVLSKNTDKNIPCHRVIRSDNKIGGYNKGTLAKQKLLQKEGFNLICPKTS
ncbi:MAG: MGMT family protein [Candidatus Pacebacteria bacterium]|jgi:methylated-DNA-[protein]-cysteine S-methyltransferase|nr:MGMT family protein [Candidatus Paceibacterota bacterium]MDD3048166.1 MGMT family protein [Candidatus Paceibacterota bacterium]NMB47327.1 MGMT family protein [Patescibacteria group bacterium]